MLTTVVRIVVFHFWGPSVKDWTSITPKLSKLFSYKLRQFYAEYKLHVASWRLNSRHPQPRCPPNRKWLNKKVLVFHVLYSLTVWKKSVDSTERADEKKLFLKISQCRPYEAFCIAEVPYEAFKTIFLWHIVRYQKLIVCPANWPFSQKRLQRFSSNFSLS